MPEVFDFASMTYEQAVIKLGHMGVLVISDKSTVENVLLCTITLKHEGSKPVTASDVTFYAALQTAYQHLVSGDPTIEQVAPAVAELPKLVQVAEDVPVAESVIPESKPVVEEVTISPVSE